MTNGPQGPGWWQASDGNWYPPAQQPNQAPPAHPGAQPSQGIAVTAHQIGINLWYLKPKIVVDGSEFPGRWGRTVVPTGPGQHHVHVHVPFLMRVGPADTVVQVQPGGLAELEYRAPAWQWLPGSLGVGPQPFNGVGIAVAVYLVFGVLAVILQLAAHNAFGVVLAIFFIASAVVVLLQSSSKPSAGRPPSQQAGAAANWYPDPNDPTLMRYFDGRSWTSQTTPRG
jgi:hypothetical protein